jgi:O-antigen/teichoic acid export membrane protein
VIKKILRSNTSWSLGANGITAFLGFLNLGLIAHQFSKDDAGKWFMLLTIYTLLEMFRSGWIQTPFVRYYVVAKDDQERKRFTGASWQLLLGFTIIIAVVLFVIFSFVPIASGAFSLAKRFTILWLFAALPYQLLQWQLQARSQFKKLSIIKIIFPVTFSVLLLLETKYHFKIETVVLIYAVLQFMAGLSGVFFGWLHFGQWRTVLKAERKVLSGFGVYSMLTMITSSLLRSSDQFIIAIWLGPAAVAVYSIPQKLIEAIEIPVRSFASIAMPKAASLWRDGKLKELREYFYSQCGLLTVIILPLLVVLFTIPTPIVNLLGGNKYHQSSMLLQIFCFYAALIPLDRYCGLLLDAGNRPKLNTVKVIFMLITNVALDLLALWAGFGLYGVAAGSTITFLIGVIIGWIQLKDVLNAFVPKLLWHHGIHRSIANLRKPSAAN